MFTLTVSICNPDLNDTFTIPAPDEELAHIYAKSMSNLPDIIEVYFFDKKGVKRRYVKGGEIMDLRQLHLTEGQLASLEKLATDVLQKCGKSIYTAHYVDDDLRNANKAIHDMLMQVRRGR